MVLDAVKCDKKLVEEKPSRLFRQKYLKLSSGLTSPAEVNFIPSELGDAEN